jgi:hypothetical protein
MTLVIDRYFETLRDAIQAATVLEGSVMPVNESDSMMSN